MIILRRLGINQGDTQDFCRVILADTLAGTVDGNNKVFSVSYEYNPGRIEIIYNGAVLVGPDDFSETGPQEITFTEITPSGTDILRANYELGVCEDVSFDFLDLDDTPNDYIGQADKLVSVKTDETGLEFVDFVPGLTNFISLTDTPTTYSGFENQYVKVNADGDGLEFVSPESSIKEGVTNIPNGVSTTAITFDGAFTSSHYVLSVDLENRGDPEPSVYPILIKDKTSTGFTVDFSGDIDSGNYYLNWQATPSGYAGVSGGIYESPLPRTLAGEQEDLTNDINLGDNLVILDESPNGRTLHGYNVGASGDASEMYVFDNPTGFACPLYMRTDGKWEACCADSSSLRMPCAALALEEDDGAIKKILWKGNIKKGSWSWTPGDIIYVSTIEGALTNVEPSAPGDWIQPIGIAISRDTIRFDPGFNPGYKIAD